MKAKRVFYSHAGAGQCEQAAMIPPLTALSAAARAASRRESHLPCFLGVFVSVYNAFTQSFRRLRFDCFMSHIFLQTDNKSKTNDNK
jgi:hypothetical protein